MVPLIWHTRGTTDLAELNNLRNFARWKARGTGPLSSNVGEARRVLRQPRRPRGPRHPGPRGARPASTTTASRADQPDGHRGADAGRRWPAAARSGCARPTRAGTRRSTRRTSTTRPTSTRCSPAPAGPSRSARRAPLAPLPRPAVAAARATPRDEDLRRAHPHLDPDALPPASTCAMGTGEDAVVDPELRVRGVDGPARRRRLGDAGRAARQHQRPHHHDRREGGRPDPLGHEELPMTQTQDRTDRRRHRARDVRLAQPGAPATSSAPTRRTPRPTSRAAVERAREAAAWWSALSFDEREALLTTWKGAMTRRMAQLADLMHQETGKPHGDALLEIALAIDHLAWAAGHAEQGARPAPGPLRAAHGQPGRDRGVPPARRDRRDRPVELPGLHADGLDRLRAGRRQRGRVQAQRVHARASASGWPRTFARSVGPPGAAGRHRPRRDRRGAVPLRRRQDRVHRLDRHRQAGDGGLRRDPHPGAHRGRRQGRAARRRGRRRRRRRRRRAVGRLQQRRADLHRRRAGLRPRAGVRRVPRLADRQGPRAAGRRGPRLAARADHDAQAARRDPRPHPGRPRPRRARGRGRRSDAVGERFVQPTILADVPEDSRGRAGGDLRADRDRREGARHGRGGRRWPTPPATGWARRCSPRPAARSWPRGSGPG